MGRPIVYQWGLFTIGNSHCAAARLLVGEFLELQARARRAGLDLAQVLLERDRATLRDVVLLYRDRATLCDVELL